jgi:hypothetical protein
MEGDLAATVDLDDRGAVGGTLVRLGALPRRVHRRVLEQQHGVRPAGDDACMEVTLELPRSEVVDRGGSEAGGLETQLAHGVEGTPVESLGGRSTSGATMPPMPSMSSLHVPAALRPVVTWGALTVLAVLVSLTLVRLLDAGPPTAPVAQPSGESADQPPRPEQVAVAVLRGWDERRAAAYSRGDVAALRELYAEGSRAGKRDVRLLRAYVGRGLVVEGLHQQLLAVQLLDEAPHRLRVRVRDRLAEATVVSPAGRVRLPRDRPSTRDVVLVRQDTDWLVWSVDQVRGG